LCLQSNSGKQKIGEDVDFEYARLPTPSGPRLISAASNDMDNDMNGVNLHVPFGRINQSNSGKQNTGLEYERLARLPTPRGPRPISAAGINTTFNYPNNNHKNSPNSVNNNHIHNLVNDNNNIDNNYNNHKSVNNNNNNLVNNNAINIEHNNNKKATMRKGKKKIRNYNDPDDD